MKRTGERLAALLLVCLALGHGREESDFLQRPAGRPANDDIAQAEWVRSVLQFRSNSSFAVAYDSYPGGDLANPGPTFDVQIGKWVQAREWARSYDFINFTANGTNLLATMENDEPSHGTHESGSEYASADGKPLALDSGRILHTAILRETDASVWWKWKSPINATMRVTTIGSTFDTTLGIYVRVPWDGESVSNKFGVKMVGRGDDILWNKKLQSEADFVAQAGVTYYIAVGGFRGASGVVKLTGMVESWVYPPAIVSRVATPAFALHLLGVPQDPRVSEHSKFVKITITCATPGALIFYTTDGLMPSVAPTITQGLAAQDTTQLYTAALPLGTFTIRAVAYQQGNYFGTAGTAFTYMRRSLLATSTSFQLKATAPTILPDGGEFEALKEVRIFPTTDEEGDPRAVIHYTLDGSEPTLASPLYAGSVVLRNVSNVTIKARVWYPDEWREDGLYPTLTSASTSLVPGMLASNVTVSKSFTVKDRLPLPAMPAIYGENDPMVLKGGNPPLAPKTFVGRAFITLSIADPLAELWFALAKSVGEAAEWGPYTGSFAVSEVGIHWIHIKGIRRGYTDSFPVTDHFEVLERIYVAEPNVPFFATVLPGKYLYYTLNLTEVGTDVTVATTKFFGTVDLFLSARQRRPSMRNHSLSATSMAVEGGEGGTRLLALHTEASLGLQVIAERESACPFCPYSTPIVVGILGGGTSATQLLITIRLDAAPVVRLSQMFHGRVSIGQWAYYKFYTTPPDAPASVAPRSLVVRVWQEPPAFVGVRVALKRVTRPSSGNLGDTPYVMFGNAQGFYQFTVPAGSPTREVWFIGVQGLVPVFGAEELHFTAVVSSIDDSDAPFPGRSLVVGELVAAAVLPAGEDGGGGVSTERFREEDGEAARSIRFTQISEGVTVRGKVRVGRFAFFRIRMQRSLRWLEVRVSEARFSGGLRIYVQESVPPSLISHLTEGVSTSFNTGQVCRAGALPGCVASAKSEGYFYTAPVYAGKDYYIGVYGFSYAYPSDMRTPEYLFALTATTVPRVSGLGEAPIQALTSNYRFFFKFERLPDTYIYYQINHGFDSRDLHIVVRLSFGTLDIFVSNVEKYPSRSLENVAWKSRASIGDPAIENGKFISVQTFDPEFKPGPYYVAVYTNSPVDFGIAAYTDQTSFPLDIGKAYRLRVTTYSYRYFRFPITKVYEKLTVIFREETSGQYITCMFMQGQKPSDTVNTYWSMTPDEDGSIRFEHDKPLLDTYYVMVHTYKIGYSGRVLSHTYTIDIRIDYFDPPGYKSLEGSTEFQSVMDQRYEQALMPRPPPWDTLRPSHAWKVGVMELGRPQTASFTGQQWIYYSVYVSTFSANLTVIARPMSPGLVFSLLVRRAEKPTLNLHIDKADTADANGEYVVRAPSPVTGGLYYIGVYGTLSVLDAREKTRLVLLATVDPGIPIVPTYRVLINYFVRFDTVAALQYRYYSIFLPADERDLTFQVTHLVGVTDIIISNVNPWPTKSNYNASQPGWWKSEAAVGGGKEIVIHNYDRGYRAGTVYYIGVFTNTFTSYFVLVRLDRPPPTVPIGTVFASQVAEAAFSSFRFEVGGLTLSRIIFVVKIQRPLNTGLKLFSKRNQVPTLLDYEVTVDVSTVNGEYFLFLDSPQPDDVFYLGVYGLPAGLLLRNNNYYFLCQILTADSFKLYQSYPYLQAPPLVPPTGNYIPPPRSSYSLLPPDTPVESRSNSGVFNNGTWRFFRVQVSEFTRVTAVASDGVRSQNNYGSLFLVARKLYLPTRRDPPPFNNSHIDWFAADVCVQQPAQTSTSTVTQQIPSNPIPPSGRAPVGLGTRCFPSPSPSFVLSPFDNFANSSVWYVGVYAMGCRSLCHCATWCVDASTHAVLNALDCGCPATDVVPLPFTITATRIPRLGLYGSLGLGNATVKLLSPYDLHKYFTVEVNGSVAVHISACQLNASSCQRAGAATYFDFYVSDVIPYPQLATPPPDNLRSEAVNGNPLVSITVLEPEGVKSLIKVGVHADASVDVRISISFSPPYYPLVVGRSYAGLLREDRWSAGGQMRTLFMLDAAAHKGLRVLLVLRPTHPRCSSGSGACSALTCCNGRNPFRGFRLSVSAERTVFPVVGNLSVGVPNAECIDKAACKAGNTAHCRGDCIGSECCTAFATYSIAFPAESAARWVVGVTGADGSSDPSSSTSRFTDSFQLDVKVAGAADAALLAFGSSGSAIRILEAAPVAVNDGDSGGSAGGSSMRDNPDGPVTPEGQYAFQSAGRGGPLASSVEEQPIEHIGDGETAVAEGVAFGKWRVYRFQTDRWGIATVTLKQHTGTFGLRLLVQREALPTHESFLTFSTMDANEELKVCSATTAVGSEACHRCAQDLCVCDPGRGDRCTGLVHGSILTQSPEEDGAHGATAVFRAPVYPKEPFMMAVFAESEVFAPYSFSITVQQARVKEQSCANITDGEVYSGRILTRERLLFQLPPVKAEHDAYIRLDTPFSDSWGRCRWGGNDGTSCRYKNTPEVYTGLSDRAYDEVCRGCSFERGWKYIGTPLKTRYMQTDGSYVLSVGGRRCFNYAIGSWVIRFTLTSKNTYPFFRKQTNWDADALCDESGVIPWTVPYPANEFYDAIKVDKDEECCDRCAREATCSFWTITENASCTQCLEQDVTYEDTVVRPAPAAAVTFIPGTNSTEWYESVPVARVRAPFCFPVTNVRCCRLLSITEAAMLRSKVPDAASVSGGTGRCLPATNGHVRMNVAQSLTCSNSSSAAINENLVVETAESVAQKAYLDDRQLFYVPNAPDNSEVCVQWWNGQSKVLPALAVAPQARPELTVDEQCVKYSSRTIKLRAKDEVNVDQCVVTAGSSQTSLQMRACSDTVYRMGNGSSTAWRFYSVEFESTGGFGVEWQYENQRFVQLPSLGSRTNWQLVEGMGEEKRCLWASEDLGSPVIAACADASSTRTDTELQEWNVTNQTGAGSTEGLLVSAHRGWCLTGLMSCGASRREWAGDCSAPPTPLKMLPCSAAGFSAAVGNIFQGDPFYKLGRAVIVELTGILSSSFDLKYDLVEAPPLITAENRYKGLLVVGSAPATTKYRFFLGSPTLQGTSGLELYFVLEQRTPVSSHQILRISYRHRQTSNLPLQRPPGWDDGASFVSGPQNGPNGRGVYVLPLASLPVAGPYDFDVTLAPNASLAGEEVHFIVRVTSSLESSLSTPNSLQTAADFPRLEPSTPVVCATLMPAKAVTCGPPLNVPPATRGSSVTPPPGGSEEWWVFYRLQLREPVLLQISLPGNSATNCSARVFVQAVATEEQGGGG